MFFPHWSLKVEYLYYELAKQTSNFATLTQNFPGGTGSAAVTHFTIEPKGSVVRVGVNYLFNWGAPAPVEAKYYTCDQGNSFWRNLNPAVTPGFCCVFPNSSISTRQSD